MYTATSVLPIANSLFIQNILRDNEGYGTHATHRTVKLSRVLILAYQLNFFILYFFKLFIYIFYCNEKKGKLI